MSDFDVSLTPAAAINVSVAGGVGPQGPTGPAGGVASVNGATGALTLAAVGGSWAVAGTTLTLTVSAGVSTWSALTGKPFTSIGSGLAVDGSGVLSATGLTSVSWGDITGKPATFAPSAHTHAIADTTGLQAALDLKAPLASPTFTGTVSGVSAAMVGLGNVDNVADASKPVSTAQAAADAVVQAYAIQRANHTGTQSVGTITGLGTLATQNGTFSGTSSGTNTGDQTITLTGDVTGSGTGSFAATLSASGVTAGTYTSVTVDAKGRVTAGSSPAVAYSSLTGIPSTFAPSAHTQAFSTITATPTTLAGYGITDALTSSSLASPPAIGATTPAAGTFTVITATSRANLPSGAAGTPAARDLYAVADTIRYRDSGNVERLLLNSADNLANLANLATARTNLGLAAIAASGSGSDISTGTVAAARLGSHASTHQTGGSDAVGNVVVSPTALSAATNNWSIGTGDVFRVSASAAYDVTGIVAGSSGQTILLVNVGSFALTLKHQSTSSTAANRFTVPWAGDCVLPASGGAVVLYYDGTSSTWRIA